MRASDAVVYIHSKYSTGLKVRVEKISGNKKGLVSVTIDMKVSLRKRRSGLEQERQCFVGWKFDLRP